MVKTTNQIAFLVLEKKVSALNYKIILNGIEPSTYPLFIIFHNEDNNTLGTNFF
ncbi:hypothetical protein HUE58_05595 [Candidatus Ruthia endofausta]|uniref:Uncharacterized protein n=1 Tax=Candidatus Ruthia endofausta TaxID=2738852 RepID=A0A6N0HQJ0_9GAMM|nr:hypothetical protein [Candidatus Ruthia endofausta]QKQ24577.1 hypothetical protein HUE58_05595 [Candidatus Ruthia endofausta]